jgi:secreted trypsin-like serine protease
MGDSWRSRETLRHETLIADLMRYGCEMTRSIRRGVGVTAVSLCASFGVVATLASPAAQARHISRAAILRTERASRFGAFPPRLVPAARQVFHAQPTSSQSPTMVPLIVGGSTAEPGTFGYMATVIYDDSSGNPQFLCSGTLVSSNVVLTAGHCGADETTGIPNSPSGYRVITNAVDWTDTTARVISDVSQVVVDSNFNPTTLYGDASMLVLSAPVTDPSIPLWASGQFSAGTGAVIAGWGDTFGGQTDWTTSLQWASTVLQNITYCANQAATRNFAYDSGSELCTVDAPDFDTSTCNGDSGGPLLADDSQGVWIEIGITSTGVTNCPTNTADFFTSILSIEPWIEAEINAAAPAPPPPPPATTTTTPTLVPTTTTSAPTTTTTVSTPKPTLGRMTVTAARSYTRKVLTGVFRGRYTRGRSKTLSCSRISASRFNCGANFSFAPNDYYSNVTVYLEIGAKNVADWTDKYTLHWVNDDCYFHSGHRRTCKIGTRRGTL